MLLQVISGAGHHVYADKSEIFNKHVLEACVLSERIPKLTSLSSIKLVLKSSDKQQSDELQDEKIQRIDEIEIDTPQPKSS